MKRFVLLVIGVIAVFAVQWTAAQLEDPDIEKEWESASKRWSKRYE